MREEKTSRYQVLKITIKNVEEYFASFLVPKGPLDCVDRLIMVVYERTTHLQQGAKILKADDYPLATCRDQVEFHYIIQIAIDTNYIEKREAGEGLYRLTPKGWNRVEELRTGRVHTTKVFVAMWFDPIMNDAWGKGFLPALKDNLGLDPVRIDFSEHIDKTDDKILAEIRSSGFVVADFTGNRGGVEARTN